MNDQEFMDELNYLSEAEKLYKKEEWPKVLKRIQEFKDEIGDQFKEARQEVLRGRIKYLEWRCRELNKSIQDNFESGGTPIERWLMNRLLKPFEKTLKKYLFEMRIKKESKESVTPEMILRAREYPIESLLDVNSRGYALCPYHDDKNPSMLVRNGFAYCFSCHTSKDAIALVMDRGMSFAEAVKFLTKS